jgi:tRNA pseudouridine(55) synthase
MNPLPPYVILPKPVGQTPLETVEFWRLTQGPEYQDVPLAYAGRLDPMASGKLLILLGDECKVQEKYHGLDKTYLFSVLFGVSSDSGDVLGLIKEDGLRQPAESGIHTAAHGLIGDVELPYPVFSSRTVQGKPLHTWALEGRLSEITIPTKKSTVYNLRLEKIESFTREEVYTEASQKIESLPPVTDPRKAIGNDFRRPEVRKTWQIFKENGTPEDTFSVVYFTCTASSGTYMRTLAEEIAKAVGTTGLAFSIHREDIGRYDKTTRTWLETF